jgi:LysR family positive regulator for ilvC
MDFKALQMFHHLSESLHFSKTAVAYHVSPSTLSRTIQRMEDELGMSLLHRDNRTVVLTQAGELLQSFAVQQLEQWQLLKLSLNQNQAELKGKLHIYCSVTAAYSHLPPLLDRFRQQHPLVEIMLTTGDAADAVEQVQNQSVDIALAAKPEVLSSSIHFHHLADVPLAIIAPAMACSVQQQLQATDIDWGKVPVILPEHGVARTRFEQWFRKKQQGKPTIYATVSGQEALISMVALGCGIGIAPNVVIDNSPVKQRIRYLPLSGASFENAQDSLKQQIAPLDLGLCCLKQSKEQPLLSAFFQAIA